ncbi:MAG TPA: metallophosphoesterase [Rhizobium sp.]
MRAWIVSDIHFSKMDHFLRQPLRIPKADVCICAGDIANFCSDSISYLRNRIEPHMPVILTLGNHDYYSASIEFVLDKVRRETFGSRVHLLENQSLEIDGYRFVGATLWTDFCVPVGNDEHIPPEERKVLAYSLVPSQIADYYNI